MENFAEILIKEVRKRKILWDRKDKNYYNRSLVDKEWSKVAEQLNESKEAVKTKWKNLRDTFRKELKKIPESSDIYSTDIERASHYTGTWPHFCVMLFLLSVVTLKASEESVELEFLPSDLVNTTIREDSTDETNETETSFSATYETDMVPPKKFKFQTANVDLQYLEKKMPVFEDKQDDEDLSFFKSLIPHVKILPSINKLRFRSQVQDLLIKEITILTSKFHENTPHSSQENIKM
ncbi:hypothetical protein PGB90_003527 [Kerria lacca]